MSKRLLMFIASCVALTGCGPTGPVHEAEYIIECPGIQPKRACRKEQLKPLGMTIQSGWYDCETKKHVTVPNSLWANKCMLSQQNP